MFTTPDEEIRKILSGKPLQQDEESVLAQNVNNDPVGSPNSNPDPFANLSKPSAEVISEQDRNVLTGGMPNDVREWGEVAEQAQKSGLALRPSINEARKETEDTSNLWREGMPEHMKPSDPTASDPESFGPPAPDPRSQTPQAKEFEKTAASYQPPSYKEGGIRRHMPQQYGQKGDPITDGEGPNSPAKTYQLLAEEKATKGGMLGGEQVDGNKMMQAKRTLGFGLDHAAIKENYQNYVDERRSREGEERAQRMQRAQENRADMAQRQESLGRRMNDWSDITGGRPVGTTQNNSMPRGVGGGAIFGRMRPMTDIEAARARRENAEADWIEGGRFATEEMKAKARLANTELQGKGRLENTEAQGRNNIRAIEAKGLQDESRDARKQASDYYLQLLKNESAENVARLNGDARKAAAYIVGESALGAAELRSKTKGNYNSPADKAQMNNYISGMAGELLAKLGATKEAKGLLWNTPANPANRDKKYDPVKKRIVDEIVEGSFDSLAGQFITAIDDMDASDPSWEPAPQITDLYENIKKEYNQRRQQQGAAAGT